MSLVASFVHINSSRVFDDRQMVVSRPDRLYSLHTEVQVMDEKHLDNTSTCSCCVQGTRQCRIRQRTARFTTNHGSRRRKHLHGQNFKQRNAQTRVSIMNE